MMLPIILEITMSLNMENKRRIDGFLTALIEVSENDAADIVVLRNNPEVNRFLSSQTTITIAQQEAWIAQNKVKEDNIYFKIFDTKNANFRGTIALYSIEKGKAEFGRFIATNAIAAIEAEYLLLKYGFEILGLKEIYCCTVKENKKVWQQHLKFGFTTIGEDYDERIEAERVIQSLQNTDFQVFDYEKILSTIKKFL
jgi:RimJ/RimL family protein N-acetyltransferase